MLFLHNSQSAVILFVIFVQKAHDSSDLTDFCILYLVAFLLLAW